MDAFVGREQDLARLDRVLGDVQGGRATMLSVRGRRQVGKSRLVSEFVSRSDVPQLFVTGSRQASLAGDLESFRQDALLNCTLPGADLLTASPFPTWEQALRAVAAALPPDRPSIVVLDEFPWLLEHDPGLDGTLQKLWDRRFESLPVLMILVGSDLSVMELLTEHSRPLFGRARPLVVGPLSVRDSGRLAGLDLGSAAGCADTLDGFLLTGGYPRLVARWGSAGSVAHLIEDGLADESTDLVSTGQRVMDAEFPSDTQAATVLRSIGAGERAFSAIASRVGLSATSVDRALTALRSKRVVTVDTPVSSRPAPRLARYRVADPYLRFWLRFVEPGVADIRRGRPDLAVARVHRDWSAYRGRAVEPIVRESLTRLAAEDPALGGAELIGGWWPRTNDPEVDLVGVAPAHASSEVAFVGSIKWRERVPFDDDDLRRLAVHRSHVPGAEASSLIAVSRSGSTARPDALYGPTELVAAWR
jgi:hypothetical protein